MISKADIARLRNMFERASPGYLWGAVVGKPANMFPRTDELLALCDAAERGAEVTPKLKNDCRVGAVRVKAGCDVSTLIGLAERAEGYRLKYGKCETCGGTGCGPTRPAVAESGEKG